MRENGEFEKYIIVLFYRYFDDVSLIVGFSPADGPWLTFSLSFGRRTFDESI
jgi:hypothetical protein